MFSFFSSFVFGGPGDGSGGPGGGFLSSSLSSGKATTETIKKKATTRTTENKTKKTTKQKHCLGRALISLSFPSSEREVFQKPPSVPIRGSFKNLYVHTEFDHHTAFCTEKPNQMDHG